MKAEDSDLRALFPNSYGYVASVRKHAVRLRAKKVEESSIAIGASKLGGLPDLGATASWPYDGESPMAFLGQLRLDELATFDEDALVPHEGLLSFFWSGEGDSAKGKVLRASGDVANLQRTNVPKGGQAPTLYTACAAELSASISFPVASSPFIDVEAIHKKERAAYDDLLRSLDADLSGPAHQVFGYVSAPDVRNLQDGDTRLLLQLDSDAATGFTFPGRLAFLGQDADLRRGEFGRVRVAMLTK